MQELGEENLEERLTSAGKNPAQPAHRLAQLIADVVPTGRPVLVVELSRGPGVPSSAALGELAAAALSAGADALAVKTDSEDTPEPLKDVLAATQAAAAAFERQRPAPRANPFAGSEPAPAPVLQRDWFLHPIQVVGAKEAGAAGILGVIGELWLGYMGRRCPVPMCLEALPLQPASALAHHSSEVQQLPRPLLQLLRSLPSAPAASVTSRGTPLMSSFAASIGLDCPVEIVNMQELQASTAGAAVCACAWAACCTHARCTSTSLKLLRVPILPALACALLPTVPPALPRAASVQLLLSFCPGQLARLPVLGQPAIDSTPAASVAPSRRPWSASECRSSQ